MSAQDTSKRGQTTGWTLERVGALSIQEIRQLRENAERLNDTGVVALCSQALRCVRPSRDGARRRPGPGVKARRLMARVKAFEARGVFLADARTSWGGVRKADGRVVMALWADAVESLDGGCRYLLWAPNVDGSRPWSEMPGGRERLEHCKRAAAQGGAEGLLVYGQPLATHLPEHKAFAVHGADAETVLSFEVEQRGAEFWATWGRKAAASAIESG